MSDTLLAIIEEQRTIIRAIDLALEGIEPPASLLKIPVVRKAWLSIFRGLDPETPLEQFQPES